MKLFNKILFLLMLIGGLQILTEELISNHELISIEVNIEIEKEEKENKDEYFDQNLDIHLSTKQILTYQNYIGSFYQNPTLKVWTTPPELFISFT